MERNLEGGTKISYFRGDSKLWKQKKTSNWT